MAITADYAQRLQSAAHNAADSTPTFYSGICNGTLGELLQGPIIHDDRLQIAIVSGTNERMFENVR